MTQHAGLKDLLLSIQRRKKSKYAQKTNSLNFLTTLYIFFFRKLILDDGYFVRD